LQLRKARWAVSLGITALFVMLAGSSLAKVRRFADLVGSVRVGKVDASAPLRLPYILWGGDFATFHANGGLSTKSGTIFDKQGLKLNLVKGDDFVGQVRDYVRGRSPFLRGTFRMIGMAAEVLNADPRTKPVVFVQLTWSAGDHLVARRGIKTIKDLRNKTIALQQGGPHVGMLDDVLRTAGLSWDQIKVVWVDDITGPKGPARAFKQKRSIDAAFVVTPDMIALTGGLTSVGSGAEGTIKGARVLDSTAYRSYTIADVYAVRSDFLQAKPQIVTKFAAGYLKAVEEVVALKKRKSSSYRQLLDTAVKIYGKSVLPNRDEADGLLSDCTFAGHPGNVAFFTDKKNPHGFDVFAKRAVELAVERGYARRRPTILPSTLRWNSPAFVGYLSPTSASRGERFRAEVVQEELERLNRGGSLDEKTIYSFTVGFEPNQDSFSAAKYGKDFRRVVQLASEYGGAVVVVRGHSDPTKVLSTLVRVGMSKGILRRSGGPGNYRYSLRGKALDLSRTEQLVRLIRRGAFDGGGVDQSPRQIMQAALNLSLRRARAVRKEIIRYAKRKRFRFDESQIQAQGVGIREPFIAVPRSMADVRKNTRVEFRLVGVSPEATKKTDFDF
jgi:ABC-type nitrate/sulfonate/bicarbonate transport system substrate-binding protein/outer membrane protein OmpA-like peptidoglycan-associated protein